MKSKRLRKQKRTKRTKGGFFGIGPSKCGEVNPSKTYSSNRSNCLKNKDRWTSEGLKINGVYPIDCKRGQVEYLNFPSDPTCKDDIKERAFNPTSQDDQIDSKSGLL
jgi:hypothetical protein